MRHRKGGKDEGGMREERKGVKEKERETEGKGERKGLGVRKGEIDKDRVKEEERIFI